MGHKKQKRRNQAEQKRKAYRTEAEVLGGLLVRAMELGRIPSKRNVERDIFLDLDEILAVLAPGAKDPWSEVERKLIARIREEGITGIKIKNAAKVRREQIKGAQQKQMEAIPQKQVEVVSQVERETIMRKIEEILENERSAKYMRQLLSLYEEFGERVPGTKEIREASLRLETASYSTLVRYLGPRQGWADLVEAWRSGVW